MVMPRLSLWLYWALVALVVLQRVFELRRARRNTDRALQKGAIEVGAGHYGVMVLLHTLFLVSSALEPWLLKRPLVVPLALSMLAVLAVATALRYWAIRALGERWTTRLLVLPGRRAIRQGPYRHLRHPNYVAVALEILALPLVHGAYLTALVFSVANMVLLRHRIRIEEAALREHSDYDQVLAEGEGTP